MVLPSQDAAPLVEKGQQTSLSMREAELERHGTGTQDFADRLKQPVNPCPGPGGDGHPPPPVWKVGQRTFHPVQLIEGRDHRGVGHLKL